MSRLRFDPRRPLFVASQPLSAYGRLWPVEAPFPWEDLGMDYQEATIHQLYANNALQHRPDLEGSFKEIKVIGDGLDQLPIDALHHLRDTINKQVKAKCKTAKEYSIKMCAFSRIKDKQIAKIRNWRSAYGDMEG